ncbi:GNAT family N-acetyltransferase [Pseudodesulfovibrio indicus]|uniref:Acetyltransferase n=1 Tax=Pseudodesulfovibrio indicus TaxID=1716143 RepID=A0A126QM04_9BACT|nr:GNAT family N-acetyltransferase [Pseudodesulfovibrio indicus]AMK10836.1 hypothetical protein AWY79_06815 [Pseudodesulfovibrio indicus]TDT91830.1 putative acetyltransferase [Pseudodesulfovibrio indicus]
MIVLRPSLDGEEPLIEDIIRRSMLASYAHFLPADRFQRILDLDRPGTVARENGPNFLIAEVDGTPAGVMLLKGDYVDHLWAAPDFMGCGVGTALLAHAEELAAKAGHERLVLDCFEKNVNALAFYRARGFVVERTYDSTTYLAGEMTCRLGKDLARP